MKLKRLLMEDNIRGYGDSTSIYDKETSRQDSYEIYAEEQREEQIEKTIEHVRKIWPTIENAVERNLKNFRIDNVSERDLALLILGVFENTFDVNNKYRNWSISIPESEINHVEEKMIEKYGSEYYENFYYPKIQFENFKDGDYYEQHYKEKMNTKWGPIMIYYSTGIDEHP